MIDLSGTGEPLREIRGGVADAHHGLVTARIERRAQALDAVLELGLRYDAFTVEEVRDVARRILLQDLEALERLPWWRRLRRQPRLR